MYKSSILADNYPSKGYRRYCARLPRPPRLTLGRLVLLVTVSLCVSSIVVFYSHALPYEWESKPRQILEEIFPPVKRMPVAKPLAPLLDRRPCYGPRNVLLSQSPDDDLVSVELDNSYPVPFVGSHEDLGLQKSWMTADGRYGPYGYGEDDLETYNRSKVNWEEVDWSQLQNDCLDLNAHRFPLYPTPVTSVQRFQFRNESMVPEVRTWDEFTPTRRTAIVVRAYDGYKYTPEDMYNLRSLIVEAGLRTGGEYSVFLLVNIRDVDANVFASDESYRAALEKAGVPKELHGISVLWDEHLLRSWYPKIEEYKTEYQVFQPMQLFALHYPEFDHFWQLELDMRFLGDAGQYLDSVSNFARNEPRKQALERSTFLHMQHKYGNYADFAAAVDAVNNGSSHVWGPFA